MHLDHMIHRFDSASKNIIKDNKNKLSKIENSNVIKNPESIIENKKDIYMRNLGKLEVLDPLLTLKRGYSITRRNNKIVASSKSVNTGDELEIEFDDGKIKTKVM